ncbi:MAG: VWA domain-containing protein [Rhabdochlamydiaceae bacterium]|nr:VWA domain-containing protein [Candidatus Amphrikana amoebophyrae]
MNLIKLPVFKLALVSTLFSQIIGYADSELYSNFNSQKVEKYSFEERESVGTGEILKLTFSTYANSNSLGIHFKESTPLLEDFDITSSSAQAISKELNLSQDLHHNPNLVVTHSNFELIPKTENDFHTTLNMVHFLSRGIYKIKIDTFAPAKKIGKTEYQSNYSPGFETLSHISKLSKNSNIRIMLSNLESTKKEIPFQVIESDEPLFEIVPISAVSEKVRIYNSSTQADIQPISQIQTKAYDLEPPQKNVPSIFFAPKDQTVENNAYLQSDVGDIRIEKGYIAHPVDSFEDIFRNDSVSFATFSHENKLAYNRAPLVTEEVRAPLLEKILLQDRMKNHKDNRKNLATTANHPLTHEESNSIKITDQDVKINNKMIAKATTSFAKIPLQSQEIKSAKVEENHPLDKLNIQAKSSNTNIDVPFLAKLKGKNYYNIHSLLAHLNPKHEENSLIFESLLSEVPLEHDYYKAHPKFFSVTIYDPSIDGIKLPDLIGIPKKPYESNNSDLLLHSPRLKKRTEVNYFNIKKLLTHLIEPDLEGAQFEPSLSYQLAMQDMSVPKSKDNVKFVSPLISDDSSQRYIAKTSHVSHPKASNKPVQQQNLNIIASRFNLKKSKSLKSLDAHYEPKTVKSQYSLGAKEPMMLKALKYLSPKALKFKSFTFESLKLKKPLLVSNHKSMQKLDLPRIESVILEQYEVVKTDIPANLKPLFIVEYQAKLEEFKAQLPLNTIAKEHYIHPQMYTQDYTLKLHPIDPVEILGFNQPTITPLERVALKNKQEVLNNRIQEQAKGLDYQQTVISVAPRSGFNLPSYEVSVKGASPESSPLQKEIKLEKIKISELKEIALNKESDLKIFQAKDFNYTHIDKLRSSLLASNHVNLDGKAAIKMQNNPAHTLSFIHKIKVPNREGRYALDFTNPLKFSYKLSDEPHKRDLAHAIAKAHYKLPGHSNRFTDYIDLLSMNEQNFYPSFTHEIQQHTYDFKPLLSRVRELNEAYLANIDAISSLPSLYELNTQILSTEFKTEVEVIAKPHQKGYYFALKVAPYFPEELRRVRQNIFFVLDQCRTINKDRFTAFKKAIIRSLPYLYPDDTFNVIVFDKRFEKLSSVNLYYSKDSINKARRYLENVSHGSLVPPQDYSKVVEYVSENFDPDPSELNVIIMLTDGAAYKAHHLQKEKVAHFTDVNNKKFAIHMISAAQHNYLSALDLVSFMNRGTMLHSKSHASLPRQLALLVKKMRYPIATDLHMSLISSTTDKLKFFPGSGYFQDFYGHKPLVIYGETDSLCEFEFMLQGKCEEEWINITQSVNLQQAIPGDRELLRDSTLIENKTRQFINPYIVKTNETTNYGRTL